MAQHARAKRSADSLANPDSAKRALCALLFDDCGSISDVLSHEVTRPLSVQPHTHADLLQLDVIVGCAGHVIVDDQHIPVSRTTLMVAHPGQAHGYTLLPDSPPSEVWLVKIRVPKSWRSPSSRPFPDVLTGLPPQIELLEAIVEFTSY